MPFSIENTKNGQGLLTLEAIEPNHIIFTFEGKSISKDLMKNLFSHEANNLLQILPDEYLDLSGKNQFFINHSCNPNTGIKTLGRKAALISIRKIKANEELTFDYSSTSTESMDEWKMDCNCGSWNCRKIVSGFQYLKYEQKNYLIDKGIVPDYVQNSTREIK